MGQLLSPLSASYFNAFYSIPASPVCSTKSMDQVAVTCVCFLLRDRFG